MNMRVRWTVEDVNKMAPDAGSVAAGRKLADARQWKLLGASDTHLWGELQGSGAKPYQSCIEREGPAFHCTCPSRKFPCKHGLALAYLEAEHSAALPPSNAPAWLAEWVNKRAEREERKQTRSEAAAKPVDAETAARRAKDQERRANTRLDRARGGIGLVSQWLKDAVRQGLATQADQPYRYWDELAARTVDAQIPGLARHFRQLPALRHGRTEWQTPFLDTIARLHLLCSAFGQYEALPPEWRGDLDAALGMAQAKEELLATAGILDHWCVLGMTGGEDEGLRYQRTWLHGERSGITALLLDFAVRGQLLPAYAPPGCSFDGEIVFYPSAWPQRALVKERSEPRMGNALAGGIAGVAAAQERYVAAAEKLPWVERVAVTLRAVTPVHRDGGWFVVDPGGEALPLSADCDNAWELLAMSGGAPLDLFCEFDGESLLPLTSADAAGVCALPPGRERIDTAGLAPDYPPWRQVLITTLLGAERQQQALVASGPVGRVLDCIYPQGTLPVEADARSRALLDAVSVLALYRRGAQLPRRIASLPAPCEAEELAAAGMVAAGHLRQILAEKDAALLHEWLATAAAGGKRCPEPLLPSLLDCATQAKARAPQLAAVLGRRGAWLARWRDEWRAVLAVPEAEPLAETLRSWEEGGVEERRAALERLRELDPGSAREKLAAVFPNEPAAVRAALLATLGAAGLSESDEVFLEAGLADKSQEVRQRAAELLSRLPGAAFNQRVYSRAGAWLTFKPKTGLLSRLGSRKGELELALPAVWDPAWTREGLVEKPPRGKGAKAWWLEQTLALIAPRIWTQQWNLSAVECLALLDGHEWRDALLGGWLQATLTQRDPEWALALLGEAAGTLPDAGMRVRLWQVLAPQARERSFVERLHKAQGAALVELLQLLPALERPWSEECSRQVLDAWRRLVGSFEPASDYRVYTLLRDCAVQLAPRELQYFEQRFARELSDEGPWHKILNETRERLRFRHALHAALAQE